MAHLEALAAGVPVVATDVGGAAEVAQHNAAMFLLPCDAGAEQFAAVLADVVASPPDSGRAAAELHFTRYRMAEGYRRLYPRAIEVSCRRKAKQGLWLITNNFSMGGAGRAPAACCSAWRPGESMFARPSWKSRPSIRPRARQSLLAANIPVLALPPAGSIDPAEAVAMLLKHLDQHPPEAVIFWNVIPQYKLLLADSLLDVPVFDVSPGEMYFSALERYFENPRPGLPYRTARQYGERLSAVIVKYQAEAAKAAEWLGTPVHVIPNGVPLDFATRDRPRDGVLAIGTAARISPQKKLEELLDALRRADGRMPPYELSIAGGVERGRGRLCPSSAGRCRGLAREVSWPIGRSKFLLSRLGPVRYDFGARRLSECLPGSDGLRLTGCGYRCGRSVGANSEQRHRLPRTSWRSIGPGGRAGRACPQRGTADLLRQSRHRTNRRPI